MWVQRPAHGGVPGLGDELHRLRLRVGSHRPTKQHRRHPSPGGRRPLCGPFRRGRLTYTCPKAREDGGRPFGVPSPSAGRPQTLPPHQRQLHQQPGVRPGPNLYATAGHRGGGAGGERGAQPGPHPAHARDCGARRPLDERGPGGGGGGPLRPGSRARWGPWQRPGDPPRCRGGGRASVDLDLWRRLRRGCRLTDQLAQSRRCVSVHKHPQKIS